MTVDDAVNNAARLLQQAELELMNLPLMERLENLADSWLGIAQILAQREEV